ncbi:hypothetical protein [Paenibacillus sp. 8b26]|uniref:hypothetical protein n=1 Tax=Paenibacillus sp. 8b26 TaxID=3424133 RepID=UPI003D659404
MGKKLKGHGLFECPRFMLPEHATCISVDLRVFNSFGDIRISGDNSKYFSQGN